MQRKMISLGFWATGLIAGFIAISGCVSVSAPKQVDIGGESVYREKKSRSKKTHDSQKINKDEAYTIARDKAINQGAHLREYDIHDKKVQGQYWIIFERKEPSRRNTWKNHFVVRVNKRGWSKLFKPSRRERGEKVHKMKKDRAYDIAHRIARREGVQLKGCEIQDKEIDGNYWIVFEAKDYKKKDGWKNCFAIRVGKHGQAELYK